MISDILDCKIRGETQNDHPDYTRFFLPLLMSIIVYYYQFQLFHPLYPVHIKCISFWENYTLFKHLNAAKYFENALLPPMKSLYILIGKGSNGMAKKSGNNGSLAGRRLTFWIQLHIYGMGKKTFTKARKSIQDANALSGGRNLRGAELAKAREILPLEMHGISNSVEYLLKLVLILLSFR